MDHGSYRRREGREKEREKQREWWVGGWNGGRRWFQDLREVVVVAERSEASEGKEESATRIRWHPGSDPS